MAAARVWLSAPDLTARCPAIRHLRCRPATGSGNDLGSRLLTAARHLRSAVRSDHWPRTAAAWRDQFVCCIQSRDDPLDHVGNPRCQPLDGRVGISTETFSNERGGGDDASYVVTQIRHQSFELSDSLLRRLIHLMLSQSTIAQPLPSVSQSIVISPLRCQCNRNCLEDLGFVKYSDRKVDHEFVI